MNIKEIEINLLKEATYNPRKDLKKGDKEYNKIKKSILEFGYVDPIIVNSDYTIIGGHQRYKVLRDIGYEKVNCVIVDLDKEKEKALNVALNKISGDWDKEKLAELLLSLDDVNAELTGFDDDEIEKLMEKNIDDDIEPEIEFTEELSEANNYIVLRFTTDIDWLQAQTLFELKTVKALHSKKGFDCAGVGRVIDGAKAIEKLTGGKT